VTIHKKERDETCVLIESCWGTGDISLKNCSSFIIFRNIAFDKQSMRELARSDARAPGSTRLEELARRPMLAQPSIQTIAVQIGRRFFIALI